MEDGTCRPIKSQYYKNGFANFIRGGGVRSNGRCGYFRYGGVNRTDGCMTQKVYPHALESDITQESNRR